MGSGGGLEAVLAQHEYRWTTHGDVRLYDVIHCAGDCPWSLRQKAAMSDDHVIEKHREHVAEMLAAHLQAIAGDVLAPGDVRDYRRAYSEQVDRAEAAEAAVERVRALSDQLFAELMAGQVGGSAETLGRNMLGELRAAIGGTA